MSVRLLGLGLLTAFALAGCGGAPARHAVAAKHAERCIAGTYES